MRLVQYVDAENRRAVAAETGDGYHRVAGTSSVHALALEAIGAGRGLAGLVTERIGPEPVDLEALEQAGKLLPPLDHPADPAHMLVTGTGLSHLGSAEGRDKMHRDLAEAATLTDSMRMFKLGLEGGKPGRGARTACSRNGSTRATARSWPGRVGHWRARPSRSTAARSRRSSGLYLIGPDGTALAGRLRARQRVLRPRHREAELSLPRPFQAAGVRIGPELLVGDLPRDLRGTSRIRRGGAVVWEKPFLSGEGNMCHTIENLERHHFKYPVFRRPGDVHAHFFGTSTLSFSDGFKTQPGDVFEIEMAQFGRPLRNALAVAETPGVAPRAL